MTKIVKAFAITVLIAGALALPNSAHARWHHGWHGGWGWGPGFGLGLGLGYTWGYPYYYGGPYSYAPPPYYGGCGWHHIRVWRYNHWALRRVWRCW